MKQLVEALCAPACEGRAAGTAGGRRARGLVRDALREAGLDPAEQRIGRSNPRNGSQGANLVATMPGEIDRWVLVAAHYDHLGQSGSQYYPGADDNAAAVAILVDVARGLAKTKAKGRGVIIAAFDAEEPPYFRTGEMGSAWYAKHASEVGPSLDRIDMMVCMDLVGHALGPEGLPPELRGTLFALGAERSEGTGTIVDAMGTSEEGLFVRRADAEIIPPLSDYDAFWKREIPFLFLTGGRSARYHTPADTPEHLDWTKMSATARWLERYVRATCAREHTRIEFRNRRDDASTLRSIAAIAPQLPVGDLLQACDANGQLPDALANAPAGLIEMIEQALA